MITNWMPSVTPVLITSLTYTIIAQRENIELWFYKLMYRKEFVWSRTFGGWTQFYCNYPTECKAKIAVGATSHVIMLPFHKKVLELSIVVYFLSIPKTSISGKIRATLLSMESRIITKMDSAIGWKQKFSFRDFYVNVSTSKGRCQNDDFFYIWLFYCIYCTYLMFLVLL